MKKILLGFISMSLLFSLLFVLSGNSKSVAIASASSIIYGDLDFDGNVNSTDYILMRRFVIGMIDESSISTINGDVNIDGVIDSTDCIILKRYILEIHELPYIRPTAPSTFIPTPPPTPTPSPTPTPDYNPWHPYRYHVRVVNHANEGYNNNVGSFNFYAVHLGGIFGDGYIKQDFTISGTAINGVDYEFIPSSVYVPIGFFGYPLEGNFPVSNIYIKPIEGRIIEEDKTVILTLNNGESATLFIKSNV